MPRASTFTNAEFDRLLRSGGFGATRVELRRGIIVKTGSRYFPRAGVTRLLTEALESAIATTGLPLSILTLVSVSFGDGFEPLPDIVIFETASVPRDLDGPLPAAAVRLIVEVADSNLADDLGEKLEDYATGGLAEYWVADVQGRLVLRHAGPQAGAYAKREPARFGETIDALTQSLRVDTAALA